MWRRHVTIILIFSLTDLWDKETRQLMISLQPSGTRQDHETDRSPLSKRNHFHDHSHRTDRNHLITQNHQTDHNHLRDPNHSTDQRHCGVHVCLIDHHHHTNQNHQQINQTLVDTIKITNENNKLKTFKTETDNWTSVLHAVDTVVGSKIVHSETVIRQIWKNHHVGIIGRSGLKTQTSDYPS